MEQQSSAEVAAHALRSMVASSGVMSQVELHRVEVFCEAAKTVMWEGVEKLVKDVDGLPILSSKSCDGTPIRIHARSSQAASSKKIVRSAGKEGHELLVSHQFVRADVPGFGWSSRAVVPEATSLIWGKSTPAILSSSYKGWKILRELGHVGVAVEHYAFDRFAIGALERLSRQYHLQQPLPALPDHIPEATARSSEIVVCTPCALHDSQNAFRWAFLDACSDQQLMRDLYVSLESLRNSHDLFQRHLSSWVASRMSSRPHRDDEWEEEQRQLWSVLGVDPDIIDIMVHDLQLEFDQGRLWYSQDATAEGDLVGSIGGCVSGVWKFIRFSCSRWLTAGSSARAMTASLILGLENFVKYVKKETGSSLWYLRGFERLEDPRCRRFIVESAMVSKVAESFQLALMKDARVALRYDDLWKAASEELKHLIGLPDPLWHRLASVCGLPFDLLRHSSICAAQTSYHFLWRRVLRPAAGLPWSLVRGDVEANLLELKDGAQPEDHAAAQIWRLLHDGFPMAQLEMTVALLGQISWSTLVAEQQHGSLACVARWQPEYGVDSLVVRSHVLHISRLLPSVSKSEKDIKKLMVRLERLQNKCPERAGGRQAFLNGVHRCDQGPKGNRRAPVHPPHPH